MENKYTIFFILLISCTAYSSSPKVTPLATEQDPSIDFVIDELEELTLHELQQTADSIKNIEIRNQSTINQDSAVSSEQKKILEQDIRSAKGHHKVVMQYIKKKS